MFKINADEQGIILRSKSALVTQYNELYRLSDDNNRILNINSAPIIQQTQIQSNIISPQNINQNYSSRSVQLVKIDYYQRQNKIYEEIQLKNELKPTPCKNMSQKFSTRFGSSQIENWSDSFETQADGESPPVQKIRIQIDMSNRVSLGGYEQVESTLISVNNSAVNLLDNRIVKDQ
ncbi:Hypothetical_protein [Hexamita inflata]|uniref:Hypothetical_protein n=1 Tax=Hexamita inflata TaxID=28002 RepID=A0AA86N6K7_9EUKA|nr:Hypothetical protein HINF_LOCUS1430 [Hexamita inflata]